MDKSVADLVDMEHYLSGSALYRLEGWLDNRPAMLLGGIVSDAPLYYLRIVYGHPNAIVCSAL